MAYTLIELLAAMFVITVTGMVEEFVAHRFDRWTGIGAGVGTFTVCVIGVMIFYRWSWKQDRKLLQKLRDKYRGIYRVIAAPSDKNTANDTHNWKTASQPPLFCDAVAVSSKDSGQAAS